MSINATMFAAATERSSGSVVEVVSRINGTRFVVLRVYLPEKEESAMVIGQLESVALGDTITAKGYWHVMDNQLIFNSDTIVRHLP
ncbi:hypothetical protein [Geomesophilobacter sediminis]|uniref:Uncharacterized protein n=1 Tax=Geomesophilobacter sediminis TaxID=2798584 RepID=A0A8J7M0A5_9BACT|nr:hypothetical protein [Geomesophilobacter sediminis]MBJ6724167.1 hypothetical protein [Geomesophilobacter sediminis]